MTTYLMLFLMQKHQKIKKWAGPSNSSITENGISRLLAGLDEGGTGPLVEAIELGDLEQMQYWYSLLSEVSVDELLDAVEGKNLSVEDLYGIFRAVHLLMQWEHTQSNELKEIVEREVVNAAEQEQKWEAERETLQNELISLQEQRNTASTSLNVNNLHEAFRAEIDALAEENLQLKRKSNELEKELNEQREKANNLEIRALGIERERTLLANNQTQLEENIRELHRRLSTKSESIQRDQKWESSKLKQRDEQALILSEQVRELAAQNDELRAEADRLSQALEQATELVKENAIRFSEFDEQLSEAEHQIKAMGNDNRELRELIENKEMEAKNKVDAAELDNRQLAELLQTKDALIERLRNQIQNQKLEIEQFRLSTEIETEPDIHQKELELDNLRQELIAATETAKRLFGNGMTEDFVNNELTINDTNNELRIRLIQMDQELIRSEKKYLEEQRHQVELEELLQQKELENVRLMADCQRYRKIAFGDRALEMKKIERQLNFRDKQIQKLRKKCSELYLEVESLNENITGKGESFVMKEDVPLKEDKTEKIKELEIIEEENQEKEIKELEEQKEEEEEEYAIELMEDEEEEKKSEFIKKEIERPKQLKRKRLSREKLIEESTTISALSTEIGLLLEEIEEKNKEIKNLEKLYEERGHYLIESKKSEENIRKELNSLKEILLFGNQNEKEEYKDPLEELDNLDNGNNIFDEIRSREHLESLEIENVELKRFVENLSQTGNEKERRMTEESRRLLYLAIREGKLERRVKISARLRQSMCEELCQMRNRLNRLLTGEESRSRQLALENEAKIFELARLQNALLHSVPLNEYNRLLRQHKKILKERFLTSSPDIGYYSATNSSLKTNSEDEEELEELNKINISKSGILNNGNNINEILLKIKKLEEINEILIGQNESLKAEKRKTEIELNEMNAFLDDLENETELKSMIANIERRFLQAIREQFDATEERESLQNELKRIERKFR
uniref:Uncharacterized protein n=1 Tax=Meloidogyne hapla TaxID=6305 RepID=A0A1I8AZC4_MELHA